MYNTVHGGLLTELLLLKKTPRRDMKISLMTTTGRMLLFTVAVMWSYRSEAGDFAKEYVVKAAISLNLTRFTQWPESVWNANSQNINLCVLGNRAIQQTFSQMENKAIGRRFLHVIPLDLPLNLEKCNVIYVSALDKRGVVQLLSGISGQPKLSIGEQDDFLEQGGLVNLDMKEGKINIQVNLDAVIRSGIKISSRVLSLTTIINGRNAGHDE